MIPTGSTYFIMENEGLKREIEILKNTIKTAKNDIKDLLDIGYIDPDGRHFEKKFCNSLKEIQIYLEDSGNK